MVRVVWSIMVISSILLMVLILMHSPKGDGIANIGGTSNLFTSQKSAETGLNKLTMYVAIVFAVCALITGFKIFM